MIERKEYSAGAVKLSYWFMEFRKVASLLGDGKQMDEIKKLNQEENLFGAPTKERADKIFNTVASRMNCIPPSFCRIFLDSDISTQKLFVLTSILVSDTLFFDFVYEVIREKMILGCNEFSDSDVHIFFKNKQVQDEKVASWTDATITRLGASYKTMLFEAGVTDRGKTIRKINKPILDPIFAHWLDDNSMGQIKKALSGVR